MLSNPKRFPEVSLKWKLLLPFLFVPIALTILLETWSILEEHRIITVQEETRIRENLSNFQRRLTIRMELAAVLAELVAQNPTAQKALAEQDRAELQRLYQPVFERLKRMPGIDQFHFHLYPGRSFLRLHRPELYGDDLIGYRATIKEAYASGVTVVGLERGGTGFSIRGVAPVYYQGRLIGSVELGVSLSKTFLEVLKEELHSDLTLYLPAPEPPHDFRVLSTTAPQRTFLATNDYHLVFTSGRSIFLTLDSGEEKLAVLIGLVKGVGGQPVALIEMSRDRAGTFQLLRQSTIIISGFGLGLLLLSLIFVWWVSARFLAPIKVLVNQAERITAGEVGLRVELDTRDEFDTLASALNKMLDAIEESRRQSENYAHLLEVRVMERTAELVASEEKFRTMVENIPLTVYRLEKDLIRTFVSPHIEKLTGWPPEDLVGGPPMWTSLIHPLDRSKVLSALTRLLETGQGFEIEYRLQDRQGLEVDVLDHAEPVLDDAGQVLYIEGYWRDIRERKKLQEQTLRAEELKTLSEISTRLAHEFRNPLSIIGLTARRLAKTLAATHPESPYPTILLDQVGRLEQIINAIQSFIKPMGLSLVETEPAGFFMETVRKAKPFLTKREVDLFLEVKDDLPRLNLDQELMGRALINLIRNAAYQVPSRGRLRLCVQLNGRNVEIKLVYPAGYLSDDRLRHFFYPFTTEDADTSLVDLPLVPVIIHKHGGVISVDRQGDDLVVVIITLPSA